VSRKLGMKGGLGPGGLVCWHLESRVVSGSMRSDDIRSRDLHL
jgi:hypothetical protein